MPSYQYIAIGVNGKKLKGTITAESPYAARKQLRLRSVHASSIEEVTSTTEKKRQALTFVTKSKKNQIIDFTKQLSTMLKSGIKQTEALSVLTVQTNDPRFRTVLTEIRDRVITGESLTETMRDYEEYFDVVYTSMIKVGEVTGGLGPALTTMAGFMEKRQRVEGKIVTAMIYPICLIVFSILVVCILTIKVIPPIAEQIEKTGQPLPWITSFLVQVGGVLTSLWIFAIIGGLFAVVALARSFFRTDRGALLRDRTLLALPVFGSLIRQRVVARFASTLSTLLGSGLPMAESLQVVSRVSGNVVMQRALNSARERILAGADIASPFRESGVISPAIAHMVTVGEKSGELEPMLKNISDDLEAATDTVIDRLSAVIEPIIIIFVAGIVGVIAYATVLPMLQLSTNY